MTNRVVNFDFLRCLCMLMIVGIHFYTHGLFAELSNYQDPDFCWFSSYERVVRLLNFLASQYFYIIFCISVNCFILITGYFMVSSRLRINRVVSIWLQTLFYSLFIPMVMYIFVGGESVNYFLSGLTPICSNTYWFVTMYIGLMMLSPFLILMVNRISQRQYKQLLLIIGIINISLVWKIPLGAIYSGPTGLLFFVFLFLVGGYIKLFGVNIGKGKYGKCFILFSLFLFFYTVAQEFLLGIKHQKGFYHVMNPYNGFLFFLSVLFFLWVKNLHLNSERLRTLVFSTSPFVFGVYLISDHPYLRKYLWGLFDWYDLLGKEYFSFL